MKYKIMDNIVGITIEDKEVKEILMNELKLYEEDRGKTNINIYIVDKIKFDYKYSNTPSIHKTFNNGFLADFGSNKVLYKRKNNITEIYLEINMKKNFLRKFLNIAYRYNFENIGHIIHELILVPANFFIHNKAIIHASSMKHRITGKTILFGGTGGVGKTSLELLLCRELEYNFISDDIAIVDNNGIIYPNLSFPKIYAYNVVENIELKNLIFQDKNVIDKLQWSFRKKLRGNSSVRRALSPLYLYNNIETKENKIDEYYMLYKSKTVNKIAIEKLNFEDAADMTLQIIKNEYHSVFQHITWHEYNCKLMGFKPILELDDMLNRWLDLYLQIFKNIQCYTIKIPMDINHDEFLSVMKKRFK
jgi:hypothetical protein